MPAAEQTQASNAIWQTPGTKRTHLSTTPQIWVHAAEVDIPSVPGVELFMDRIKRVAIVDEVIRVVVDVGFSPPTGGCMSVLWSDKEYNWFDPGLPLENILMVLEGMKK